MSKRNKQKTDGVTVRIDSKRVYQETGVTKLIKTREIVQNVVATLRGGKVRTTSGDVWTVIKDPTGKNDFYAVS